MQDRLVKELRLRNISTTEDANTFAEAFTADYNSRFEKPAKNPKDMHRPLAPHEALDGAMCVKSERTVSHSLTLLYDKVMFILEESEITKNLPRKRVTVCDYPDGRLEIEYEGVSLPYRTFDKIREINRAAIVENKRLGPVLEMIAEQQKQRQVTRSKRTPKRRGLGKNMFVKTP